MTENLLEAELQLLTQAIEIKKKCDAPKKEIDELREKRDAILYRLKAKIKEY
jgi:ElaB/YqjD/DUF883 family membrane-anchored ribosome-binding protein